MKARKALTQKLKPIFRRFQSQPISRVIGIINPILRGWVNYFRVGMSSQCFGYIKDWVEKKIRRHFMKARQWRTDEITNDEGENGGARYSSLIQPTEGEQR